MIGYRVGSVTQHDAEIPDHRSCITCLSQDILVAIFIILHSISYRGLGYEHLIDMLSCIHPSGQARMVSILIINICRPTEILLSDFFFFPSVGLHVAPSSIRRSWKSPPA